MTVRVRFLGSGDSYGSGGRFMTCILVETPSTRFLIDCGDSSLIAMKAQGVDPNSIDAILLSHLHGDHCAGVPFLVIDGMLAARRNRPLVVAGPPGFRSRLESIREALFPGSHGMKPGFALEYREIGIGAGNRILDLSVRSWKALHNPDTFPTMLRVEWGAKVITYSGDTDWTEDLVAAADGADLLISECYFYDKAIKHHMNYVTLKANLHRLNAKRVVLTHMSSDMLAHAAGVPEECAYDGMALDL